MLAKFNPVKIDVIRHTIYVNNYDELFDEMGHDWEFFEEIDEGKPWPSEIIEDDSTKYNTQIFVYEEPVIKVDQKTLSELNTIREKVILWDSVDLKSKKLKQARERKFHKWQNQLLQKLMMICPTLFIKKMARSLLSKLCLLKSEEDFNHIGLRVGIIVTSMLEAALCDLNM